MVLPGLSAAIKAFRNPQGQRPPCTLDRRHWLSGYSRSLRMVSEVTPISFTSSAVCTFRLYLKAPESLYIAVLPAYVLTLPSDAFLTWSTIAYYIPKSQNGKVKNAIITQLIPITPWCAMGLTNIQIGAPCFDGWLWGSWLLFVLLGVGHPGCSPGTSHHTYYSQIPLLTILPHKATIISTDGPSSLCKTK